MKNNECKHEAGYQMSMTVFKKWLSEGLLTEEEFTVIDTKLKRKYEPKIGSLFSDPSLL
jgi:hypothetical protein